MGHGHGHTHGHHHHGHAHPHDHDHAGAQALPAAFDTSVPDEALSPEQQSRRSLLRRAGLLGAGLAAGTVLTQTAGAAPAQAAGNGRRKKGFLWLAGDHHIHTQYSSDGKYRVVDQVRQGARHGMDWLVITDHGSVTHAKIGVEKVNPDIREARDAYGDTLVFQGLEWNIPAAEHGTVFVHPGKNEVSVLKQFETDYDGGVKGATDSTPANEALAVAGLSFLADQVKRRKVKDALMLANHPARKGIDSPHEIRAWRDATSRDHQIAVGFEGAPGHQAAGLPEPLGMGRARGIYDGSPGANSFPGYPLESYRTWGGFDWMTATVGGLWDSLLAEGRPWWITANSDSHQVYADTAARGGGDFNANGRYDDPVYAGKIDVTQGDYWPGQYSRTHVGSDGFSYAAVMDGIRAGRIWVDHGQLISGLDVRVSGGGRWATLGGALHVRKGTRVTLTVDVALAGGPNWAGFTPKLARVDVVQGDVTGPVADKDTFTAPTARVVKSYEVNKDSGTVRLTYDLGRVDRPVYLRTRGTDGNRTAVGALGAGVDPAGPAIDVVGDADPWRDLWFYSNPVWILPS
ncbi:MULTISPECIES: PHP domain-containing protein [Streptomyces]|uniref:PHP domain-containing protein n=1 Tax=Streptomyces rochei TaxID=1928 RepID=A0ABW7E0N2_STRRO|nr:MULTISPECIES: PHP domain-containing protein [Streptomyces]MBQ0913331.1 PHP domain-containing protein [Streptomyces sp. RM99]MBU8552589.1 PHP domain-containing protein [Streptomyces sp. Osf17]MBU8559383.1 PHP domain-containing protein [Streptomyces sp. Babs14]MCC8454710.1 PHP domain-containing protein [Streptomyces rochei]NUV94125.1 PHP domain-containing protein [Streptomyces sp. KAI 90]